VGYRTGSSENAGQQHSQTARSIQAVPTILDFADVEVPGAVQGRILKPLLQSAADAVTT